MAEGAVALALAFALAGCAGGTSREALGRTRGGPGTWGADAYDKAPDALDYLGNVQCGALASVRGDLNNMPAKRRYYEEWRLFLSWAQNRAKEAGQDASKAGPDIDALAGALLAETGEGDAKMKLAKLSADHEGALNVCRSAVDNLGIIIVLGG